MADSDAVGRESLATEQPKLNYGFKAGTLRIIPEKF